MNNYVKAKIKLLTVLMLASMIAVGAVFATTLYIVYLPSIAVVPEIVEIKICNATGAELANLNWETVIPGINNSLFVNVTNIGNVNVALTLNKTGLPADWDLAWNYTGQTLLTGESVSIELLLYVKAGEVPGNYNWVTSIRADEEV